MAKDDVLTQVAADLEQGHTFRALQRLATLTATHPRDVGVRGRRAAVCRQVGNVVEAGRWGYLTEDVAAAEVEAFERAYPDPWQRLRVLRVTGDPSTWAGPVASARVRELSAAAAESGPPVQWTDASPQPRTDAGDWAFTLMASLGCLGVLVVVICAVVGAIVVVRAL